MTFGFSRDDASHYLDSYLDQGILKVDPFITIDREGVGQLMKMAIGSVRRQNPAIKIGVCGEHGGDPESIDFFHTLGVDYVSCSPSRLRIAQLAVAQASPRFPIDIGASEVYEAPSSPIHSESMTALCGDFF
jgi:pyruvate,orthophosphate dikinase